MKRQREEDKLNEMPAEVKRPRKLDLSINDQARRQMCEEAKVRIPVCGYALALMLKNGVGGPKDPGACARELFAFFSTPGIIHDKSTRENIFRNFEELKQECPENRSVQHYSELSNLQGIRDDEPTIFRWDRGSQKKIRDERNRQNQMEATQNGRMAKKLPVIRSQDDLVIPEKGFL